MSTLLTPYEEVMKPVVVVDILDGTVSLSAGTTDRDWET